MYSDYIHLVDKKSSGTDGGSSTAGSWQTRTLTDELADTGNLCTLSSNQFTLEPGTYRTTISAPAWRSDGHQIHLYNITDGAMELLGTSALSVEGGNIMQTRSFIVGRFTIAAQKTFEVQHRVTDSAATVGHGWSQSWGDNIYTIVELWRESDASSPYGPLIQVV